MSVEIKHTCNQCDQEFESHLNGYPERPVRDQKHQADKVYVTNALKPRVCVVFTVQTYQKNEEICPACSIKAYEIHLKNLKQQALDRLEGKDK